jgi:hypothetical protein
MTAPLCPLSPQSPPVHPPKDDENTRDVSVFASVCVCVKRGFGGLGGGGGRLNAKIEGNSSTCPPIITETEPCFPPLYSGEGESMGFLL